MDKEDMIMMYALQNTGNAADSRRRTTNRNEFAHMMTGRFIDHALEGLGESTGEGIMLAVTFPLRPLLYLGYFAFAGRYRKLCKPNLIYKPRKDKMFLLE